MVGGIIAAATSAVGNQIKGIEAKDAEDRAYTKTKELMRDQYNYNNKMAEENERRAREMWNYTNFENQKKHLLEAGLSPGLFYGGAGGGGATVSGSQGEGVGLGHETGVGFGIQEKALGLQLASTASQIALNESQAKKNNAEANKIAGADTALSEADAKYKNRITELQDEVEANLKAKTLESGAQFHMIQSKERQVWAETRKAIADAEVSEGTKDELIKSAALANWKTIVEGLEKKTKIRLHEQLISKLKNDMAVAWANVALGEKSVSSQADEIANRFLVDMRDLDRKDKELLKDWIYEGVHAGKEISGEVLNWITRGVGKNVQEVAGKIEEWFNSEGEVTMTKTTQMDKKTMK